MRRQSLACKAPAAAGMATDLATNRELETPAGKFLFQETHKLLANAMLLVVSLKGVALGTRAVAANGRHVDHAVAKLDKSATLLGNL